MFKFFNLTKQKSPRTCLEQSGKGLNKFKFFKRSERNKVYEQNNQHLIDSYSNSTLYFNILLLVRSKLPLHTDLLISSRQSSTVPKSKSKVLKKYGKPLLYLNCNSRLNVELFKYRIRIGRYHTKLILYYHKDVLEMYSLIFTSLSDADRLEIHNMIQAKYLDGKLFDYEKHKLLDKSGGLVLVENSFGLTIHYITNISSSFITSVEAAERQLVKAEKKKIAHNFDKLFDSL